MSFDQMEYEDLSWIRWDRMRWEFVDLLIGAAEEHVARPRSVSCDEHDSCREIEKSLPRFGVESHLSDDGRYRRLDHRKDLMSLVTSGMREGLMMAAQYIEWGSGHPLEGAMEVPFEIGRIINSQYFTVSHREDKFAPHVSDEPSSEIRELLYAFVKLAFPDQFLVAVHEVNRSFKLHPQRLRGTAARAAMVQMLESGLCIAPNLPDEMVEFLETDMDQNAVWSEQFSSFFYPNNWKLGAGHDLELGMEEASLRRYWEGWESLPWAFEYSEKDQENGVNCGFIAKSFGLFVCQQAFGHMHQWTICRAGINWNRYTESFNEHLAPLLDSSGYDGSAMVVFSDYRGDAYIVSSVEESWDEYAPMSAVLGPLPHGFGIVGVWTNYDEARYMPRSFDEIINANWSEQITASARYLRECLTATNNS